MRADVVLHGGNVVTMDPGRPRATAVAIQGDTILAVGTDEEILATASPHSQRVDLSGRTVVPGLIDSHTHLELTTYSRHHWTDVRDLSVEAILRTVSTLAESTPRGTWVVLQGTFGQELPERAALDRAAPHHPVAVRWSMHKFQLNSAGLEAASIDGRAIAPPGTRIHFDAHGSPTGLVEEGWDLLGWRPPLLDALQPSLLETASSLFLRFGVTTLHDIAASPTGIAAYQRLSRSEKVLPRIGLALTVAPGHQPLVSGPDFWASGLRSGIGNARLELTALKIFVDGGRDGALRLTDMHGHAHTWGVLTRTPQRLAEEVAGAVGAGFQVWIHAIGDMAQELTVGAIEQTARAYPGGDHRTRIEHFGNEIYDGCRLDRLVAAGGIPAPNPSFIYAEPNDPLRRLPPGVVKYGIASLLAAGARPPGNSDTAGAQPFACNPWFTMSCMVERRNRHGTWIDPEQAVTPEQALRAFTVDAAYATFHEHDRGMLAPGYCADLVVCDRDPLSCDGAQLAEVRPILTMVGGRSVRYVNPLSGGGGRGSNRGGWTDYSS